MTRRAVPLLLTALVLGGCGLGPGAERKGAVELRVTRDFGRQEVRSARFDKVRRDQTVLRLLSSRFDVQTRYGGRFVQSIGGLQGRGAGGRRDWFYFVNGVEAHVGAAEYVVRPRDVVQWDYRRWDRAMSVPAIVGAFPQPFVTGVGKKRLPVRVECADPGARSCGLVKERLRVRGIAASGSALGTSGTQRVIRVVVAPWRRARIVPALAMLAGDPQRSGVFARFSSDGSRLLLLADDGRVARTAPPRTGLVAAFSPSADQVVWAVTGTDEAALQSAAGALDERSLRGAYALAAGPAGLEKLPLKR